MSVMVVATALGLVTGVPIWSAAASRATLKETAQGSRTGRPMEKRHADDPH